MQFTTFAAALALAGFAVASPAPQQVTVTASRTTVVTITTCGPAVIDCPARTETQTAVQTYIYPAGAFPTAGVQAFATGAGPAGAYGTGVPGSNNGANGGSGANGGNGANGGYNMPKPSGYQGPSFNNGAGQMKAGAALAGVGAVAALLL